MTDFAGVPTNLTSSSTMNTAPWYADVHMNTVSKGVKQIWQNRVSLADFGAAMDGTTDDSTAVSSWLDHCNTNGKIAYIPPNVRILTGQINKTYRIHIDGNNATIVMKSGISGFGPHWRFTGSITSSVLTAANVAAGATTITLASGWAATLGSVVAGTILRIGKDVPWTTDTAIGRDTEYIGQTVQVQSVSGDVVTLREAIVLPYNTANATKVWKINTINDVIVENLNFEGIYSGTVRQLDLDYVRDLRVNNCKFASNGSMGLSIRHCYHYDIQAEAYDLADDTPNNKFGYGICVEGACSHGRVNASGARCRHIFTTNGQQNSYGGANNLIISGYGAQCTAEAFDTHASGTNVTFQNIIAVDNPGGGAQVRSARTTVLGCHFADNPHHIKIGWDGTDCKIIANYFGPTQRYSLGATNAPCFRMENMLNDQFARHMVFSGNTFDGIRDTIFRMGTGTAQNYVLDFVNNDVINFGIDSASGDQAIIRSYSTTNKVGTTDTNGFGINILWNKIRSTASAPHIIYGSTGYVGTILMKGNVIGTNITKAQAGHGATLTDPGDNQGGI